MRRWMLLLVAVLLMSGVSAAAAQVVTEVPFEFQNATWCYQFNFKSNAHQAELVYGEWTATRGFESEVDGDKSRVLGLISLPSSVELLGATWRIERNVLGLGIINVRASFDTFGIEHVPDPLEFTIGDDIDPNENYRDITVERNSLDDFGSLATMSVEASNGVAVTLLTVYGNGDNPFPFNHCGDSTPTPSPSPTGTLTLTPAPTHDGSCLLPGEVGPTAVPSATATAGPSPTPVSSYIATWDHVNNVGPHPSSVSYGTLSGVTGQYWKTLTASAHGWGQAILTSATNTVQSEMQWVFPSSYLTHVDVRASRNGSGANSLTLTIGGVTYNASLGPSPGTFTRFDIPDGYYSSLTVHAQVTQTFALALISGIRLYAEQPQTPPPTIIPTCTATPTITPSVSPTATLTRTPTPSPTPYTLTPTPSRTPTRTPFPTFLPPTNLPTRTPNPTVNPTLLTPVATVTAPATSTGVIPVTGTATAYATFGGPGSGGSGGNGIPMSDSVSGVTDIGGAIMGLTTNIWQRGRIWVSNLGTTTTRVFNAWTTAVPTAPPMMPRCASEPLLNEVCAFWYILRFTLLSGPIGSLLIPTATIVMDLFTLFFFITFARAIVARLGEVLNS